MAKVKTKANPHPGHDYYVDTINGSIQRGYMAAQIRFAGHPIAGPFDWARAVQVANNSWTGKVLGSGSSSTGVWKATVSKAEIRKVDNVLIAWAFELTGLGIAALIADSSDDAGTIVVIIMIGLWLVFLMMRPDILSGINNLIGHVGIASRNSNVG